jgi:hypothetical protein
VPVGAAHRAPGDVWSGRVPYVFLIYGMHPQLGHWVAESHAVLVRAPPVAGGTWPSPRRRSAWS